MIDKWENSNYDSNNQFGYAVIDTMRERVTLLGMKREARVGGTGWDQYREDQSWVPGFHPLSW